MPRCHHLGRSVRPVTKEGRKRWAWVRGVCACPYHLGERKGFHIRSGSAWAEHLKILTLRSAPERSIRIFKCSAGALRILNAPPEHLEFQMLLSNTPPEHLLGPYGFKEGQISWIWSVNSSTRGVYRVRKLSSKSVQSLIKIYQPFAVNLKFLLIDIKTWRFSKFLFIVHLKKAH